MSSPDFPSQSRLLKANDIRGLGSKVAFNFEDFRRQGDAYLETIQRQAREALTNTQSQVETIRQQAQNRGLEEGRQQGLQHVDEMIEKRATEIAEKTAREGLATSLPAMRAAAEALVIERDRWLAEWETTAVRLAASIAQRVIRHRVEIDPQRTREMMRDALQLAAGVPHLKLKLHPEDVLLLGDHAEATVQTLAVCGQAEIVPDASIGRGSCIIETQHGTIDARVETLLERIVSELLENHG